MFNGSTIPNQIKSGHLHKKIIREGHPSPLRSGQPHCTYSQILSFSDSQGNRAYRAMHNVTGGRAVKPFKM